MSTKNYLNIHVLISHNPSCLNRDDMNMQKSAVFGGVRRVRISSQSLKRAMRHSPYYQANIGESSIRTRQLGKLKPKLVQALDGQYSEELVEKAIQWISGKAKEGKIEANTEADAVAPWAVSEVARYCELIQAAGDDLDEKALKKRVGKESGGFRDALQNAVDIALSGRMATSGLMTNIDGAMALAHSITTHTVDADIDWFTAVDDLVSDEGEVGAGHMDTQEFSSGVFYRYASINIPQLQNNLGDVSREQALDVAKHVVHMMSTVVPTAKRQSLPADNLADFVMTSFADIPVSLANAFEAPVKQASGSGFLKPSIDGLVGYWSDVHKGYGLDEDVAAFILSEVQGADGIKHKASLPELVGWVGSDGE